MSQPHYYLLAGESLHALNRLIEYDRLGTNLKLEDLLERAQAKNGKKTKPAAKTDTAIQTKGFTGDFHAAQIKCYQQKLGFHDLPVQVRSYADGTIYRAYHVLPKFVMNPGTSTNYFGLADLFNKPENQPEERVAICLCYEDYKGNHFAPPGAKKLTQEELQAFALVEEDFDHYREYDQGTEMPVDFDPQTHQTINCLPKNSGFPVSSASHNFILKEDVQKDIAAYDQAHQDWRMAYQDFRHTLEETFQEFLKGGKDGLLGILVEDTRAPENERAFKLYMSRALLEERRQHIKKVCDIISVNESGHGRIIAVARPRHDDKVDDADKDLVELMRCYLAKTPVEPQKPTLYDTLPGSSIDVKLTFDADILGFPYMQIEKPQDADVRILAFRLPPNVQTVDPPNADCKKLTQDEYVTFSGAETYFNNKNLPSHAFRIEGETLAAIRSYEAAYADYKTKNADFQRRIEAILRAIVPDCKIDKYELSSYKTRDNRDLELMISEKDFLSVREDLLEHLAEVYPSRTTDGMRHLKLKSRTDTEKGRALHAALEHVPYEPEYPIALAKSLGFYANRGYGLMCTENLEGIRQKAVLYIFPQYVKDVEAPEGTFSMSKEEFLHFIADSFDIRSGTVPPPRPAHISGLPSTEGKSLDHARRIRDSLKDSGFPLGHRSDFGWFKSS